jgi:mannose-6-phosphate isomerase-like protein (cupin superfamily)
MTMIEKVALAEVAAGLGEFWSQRVVGEANGSLLKVAKGIRSTTWHTHQDQEEVLLVTEGRLVVQLRSGDVTLDAGEMLVIPRGVEHCPVAQDEVHLLVIGRDITSNAAGGKPAWSYRQEDGRPDSP